MLLPQEVIEIERRLRHAEFATAMVGDYYVTVERVSGEPVTLPARLQGLYIYVRRSIWDHRDNSLFLTRCTAASLRSALIDVLNACRLQAF